MGKRGKILSQMKSNPKGWRFSQVAGMLEAYGFLLKNRRGSHCVFKHEATGIRLLIPEHGSGTLLPVYVRNAIRAIDQVTGEIK